MHRLNLLFVALFSVGTVGTVATLDAAPPTEQDWWTGIGRYMGTFNLMIDGSDEPKGEFTMRWEEPFKLTDYAYHGTGDAMHTNAGFSFWNPKNKRAEFTEVMEVEEGRFATEGYCTDISPTAVTWNCRCWNDTGLVRTFTITDTFDAEGDISRAITNVTGGAIKMNSAKWKRKKRIPQTLSGCRGLRGHLGLD